MVEDFVKVRKPLVEHVEWNRSISMVDPKHFFVCIFEVCNNDKKREKERKRDDNETGNK